MKKSSCMLAVALPTLFAAAPHAALAGDERWPRPRRGRHLMSASGAAALIALALAAPALGQATRPRAGAAAVAITPTRLLGRWGDNGDCGKLVVFRGDGTFRAHDGGEGNWRLAGERLTMTGANGSFVLIVRLIDRNRLHITNPDGSTGISQRC